MPNQKYSSLYSHHTEKNTNRLVIEWIQRP